MNRPRLDPSDPVATAAFVRANTHLLSPPLVPEVRLHLAEESLPIWQRSEEELGEMNVPPPFWAFAWAGGQALARYLLDNRLICNNKTVLDLGSGSGLAAIAAALCGAQNVVAAEIDGLALAACGLNAEANGVRLGLEHGDLLGKPPSEAEIVLVGDLFYERPLAERVVAYVSAAKAQGATVLIGDPQRSYFPRDRFTRLAEYYVPVTRELEDSEIKKTAVWQA